MNSISGSYRHILKAITIFSGLQAIISIVMLVRSKFIALLLGTSGMGVMSLLTASTDFITSLTGFGLRTSAVRNIAELPASDISNLREQKALLRRLAVLSGLFGMIITITLSGILSTSTFGDSSRYTTFIILSFSIFFTQISASENAILQGLGKLRLLSLSGSLTALASVAATIVLVYYFSLAGIAYSITVAAILSAGISFFLVQSLKIGKQKISLTQTFKLGKKVIRLGVMLTLSGLLASANFYLLRLFINKFGSLSEVGLFNAGFAVVNTYVGMFFVAMTSDFYPRLVSTIKTSADWFAVINKQIETGLLILSPLLLILISFTKYLVLILYSADFLPIIKMIQWAVLGVYFKLGSWAMVYSFIAKGQDYRYLRIEILSNIYSVALSCIGFLLFGLEGLGVGYFALYLVYFIHVFLLCRKQFAFLLNNNVIRLAIMQLCLAIVLFISIRVFENDSVIFKLSIICISLFHSIKSIKKLLGQ